MLPHERIFNNTEKQEVDTLKANKKMVKDKMSSVTGKQILLKDLSNIQAHLKMSSSSRNDLNTCLKKLTDKHGESYS